jgi:membrane-associated tyrosine- and threonine-specific cdc2-inhibitory kinase
MCSLDRHQNLVHTYDFWEENHQLYIQTELCECSLQAYLLKHEEVPELLIWNWAYDITRVGEG